MEQAFFILIYLGKKRPFIPRQKGHKKMEWKLIMKKFPVYSATYTRYYFNTGKTKNLLFF